MKKYILVLVIPIIITIIFGYIISKNTEDLEELVKVSATPVTSHVIVIDAGHGKPDEGAVGLYGTTEEAINLKIAFKLQKLIEQSGGTVYLTRSDENDIYSEDAVTIKEKKRTGLQNRAIIANQEDVDICVSIHLNKYEDGKYKGWQTFYQENNEDSKILAEIIQDSLNDTISKENNRKAQALKNVYLIEHVKKPTVIVECGFLSNEEEVQLLRQEEYQNKIAWGIYIGIQNYFRQN